MRINLIAVGKCRERYWSEAVQEYLKRLSAYAKCSITEVADEKTKEGASERENELVREVEGKRILKHIPEGAYVIALAIEGSTFDSIGLSEKLGEYANSGKSSLVLIIGGSLGLSSEVLARADEAWSFSRLTFPHQMMRVILLEQLYRGFRILNREPYHK